MLFWANFGHYVIIYREYHKNYLHAIISRLRGHLPTLRKKIQLSIEEKEGQNGEKEFHFSLGIDLHFLTTFHGFFDP